MISFTASQALLGEWKWVDVLNVLGWALPHFGHVHLLFILDQARVSVELQNKHEPTQMSSLNY